MTGYRAREITPAIVSALESLPVVNLTGMRQTGKTTLLREEPTFKNRRYVTLDDYGQLQAARNDPEGFVAGDDPVTIDEAQRCPELFIAIKKAVDRKRRPGRFLLSGSANFRLHRDISESLAGRALSLVLHPLTRRELRGTGHEAPFIRTFFESVTRTALARGATVTFPGGRIELTEISKSGQGPKLRIQVKDEPSAIRPEEILKGGLPPVALGQVKKPTLWYRGFEQTYLERDLRDLAQVGDLVHFRNLMKLAANRTGQILNQSELGRDAKLTAMTTGRYLGLMETSHVLWRMTPYLGNRACRVIKAPKLLIADSGLAAHLAGVTDLGPGVNEALKGPLHETYFAQNLAGILSAHWQDAELHYWAVAGRHEVDFIIEDGKACLAIEIKAGTRWSKEDLAGLKAFLDNTKSCRAAILAYNGKDAVSLGDRLWAIPIGVLLA